jgi:hypothetical protein
MYLIAVHTLKDVGSRYFDRWKYASAYDWQDEYRIEFFSAPGRIAPYQNGEETYEGFHTEVGTYILSDGDEFFDFGEFVIYSSWSNDWVILTNNKDLHFQRPPGFRGHTAYADSTAAYLYELSHD